MFDFQRYSRFTIASLGGRVLLTALVLRRATAIAVVRYFVRVRANKFAALSQNNKPIGH